MSTSLTPILIWDVWDPVSSIAILPGGSVICVRDNKTGLQVYDKMSRRTIEHPISDMCEGDIRGVSVCDDGATVAAVERICDDFGSLQIYTSVNGYWEQDEYTTCEMPVSVACTDDGHFIVGSFNNSIYKYKHDHVILEKKLSFCPKYISTDHKNRILISNTYGRCVTVYDEDGVEMFSFPAATDQRKLKPRGLCVDKKDNILVVDDDSKSVLVYDPRGQFLTKLEPTPTTLLGRWRHCDVSSTSDVATSQPELIVNAVCTKFVVTTSY